MDGGAIMNDKQQILAALRGEFDRWEELLTGMSEEQITAPYAAHKPYNLSLKDVIAHLRAWQQRSVARLEAALLDKQPVFPRWPAEFDPDSEADVELINAWIYANSRDQPWSSVYRDWRAGFLRLLELGEAIPEKDLLDPGRYPWLGGYPLSFILVASGEHHREHLEKFNEGV